MKLISRAFANGGYIPAKYSKQGGNLSLPFEIIDTPVEAKSLAIICHDPDSSGDFTHWVVWGIDPSTKEIGENSIPIGAISGFSSWNIPGWGGPQPPSGVHRYIFNLYALDIALNLSLNANRKMLEAAIVGHVIEAASLTGLFASI
jgi:Raf kinase inhibitor-like YbhB/YbcL family protein